MLRKLWLSLLLTTVSLASAQEHAPFHISLRFHGKERARWRAGACLDSGGALG